MKIKLLRIEQLGEAISGSLYFEGKKLCDTAENAAFCLAKGSYEIVRYPCKLYRRAALLVIVDPKVDMVRKCKGCTPPEDVSINTACPCFCPQLKPGNGACGRKDGSIRVGSSIIPGCLEHPLEFFNQLSDRIRKRLSRGGSITLIIE